ncbi:MAG: tetratricopeptide repeat protein [Muribaculaceae bacterium]|nr:tetratricopeptide repeat protein [Muribaculaceae bacterium]
MKIKFLFSLALGAMALTASAQQGGYQDGVDNYNAGRMDVAKIILTNTMNEPQTDKAVSYYYLGCIALDEKNTAEAKKNFEAGVAANPQNGYNYIGLGEIDLMSGNKSAAEKQFKAGLDTDKKNTALLVAVARAYWSVDPVKYAKDIDKNIAKALKESKNSEAAVYVLWGDMKAKENPGEAAGQYEMAITQDDEKGKVNREAYVKYANTYFKVNPQYAIEKLVEFNEKDPTSALAQRELAEKYYDNDQFGSACIQYGKYMENPNHFQRDEQRYAGLLFSAKEYDKSKEVARKVLQSDPDNFYMYRVLLLNDAALENWGDAVQSGDKLFNHAKAGDELIANDYILYGKALSNTNQPEKAVSVFEKAIQLNPDKPELLTELSAVYDRAGDQQKAVDIMKQYLDMGNGSVTDLLSMARRYQSLATTLGYGTPEFDAAINEAVKYADMAIEKGGDTLTSGSTASLWRAKGQMLLAKANSEPDAATVEAYNKALELLNSEEKNLETYKPYYGEIYRVLGAYYILNKDNEKAKEYFQKYLEVYPDDTAIADVVSKL